MTSGVRDELVPGLSNFRDVGGLPAGTGVTRSGVLFRSGNFAKLDEAGRQALTGLGIRRIIDLRDDAEVTYQPSLVEGLDIRTQRVPLFLGSVASFFDEDLTLDAMYRRILDDSAERVVEVARGIIEDQPVVVHCTVGKDRTGVTVAIALAAAGVEEHAVVADYARTEGLLPAERNRRVVEAVRRMHPGATNGEELATRSPARVMHGMLAGVRERHGSAAGYLADHGMTSAELAELRRVLVADAGVAGSR